MNGAERRGPRFGATTRSDLMLPRAAGAELIALCCVVCLLAMSRSDRQHTGVICEQERNMKITESANQIKRWSSTSSQRPSTNFADCLVGAYGGGHGVWWRPWTTNIVIRSPPDTYNTTFRHFGRCRLYIVLRYLESTRLQQYLSHIQPGIITCSSRGMASDRSVCYADHI